MLVFEATDEAAARFREGLRYDPDDAEAHYGLGSALAMQRKREDAISEIRQALKLRPDYAKRSNSCANWNSSRQRKGALGVAV